MNTEKIINKEKGNAVLPLVSNSVCPQCGKEKAPKEYTCLKCYMKRIKTN